MVCKPCRRQDHKLCPGGTWCDCQHRPVTVGTAIEYSIQDPVTGEVTARILI